MVARRNKKGRAGKEQDDGDSSSATAAAITPQTPASPRRSRRENRGQNQGKDYDDVVKLQGSRSPVKGQTKAKAKSGPARRGAKAEGAAVPSPRGQKRKSLAQEAEEPEGTGEVRPPMKRGRRPPANQSEKETAPGRRGRAQKLPAEPVQPAADEAPTRRRPARAKAVQKTPSLIEEEGDEEKVPAPPAAEIKRATAGKKKSPPTTAAEASAGSKAAGRKRATKSTAPKASTSTKKGRTESETEPAPVAEPSPPKAASPDASSSSKVPIYMRVTTPNAILPAKPKKELRGLAKLRTLLDPSPKKTAPPASTAAVENNGVDVYDLAAYGEEEFGPEADDGDGKKKKRKRPRKPNKKPEILLTFKPEGMVEKVVKGEKPKQPPPPRKPLVNIVQAPPLRPRQKPPPPPPTTITVSSATEARIVPTVTRLPKETTNATDASSIGFTRDCDDFFPSCGDDDDDDYMGDNETNSIANDEPTPQTNFLPLPSNVSANANSPRTSFVSPEAASRQPQTVISANQRSYKTPMVPKHVSKKVGKVSTPRLPERIDDTYEPKPSTKELIKISFGFDEEPEGNESLLGGISPVKNFGPSRNNFTATFNDTSMLSNASRLSTFSNAPAAAKKQKTEVNPWRFQTRAKLKKADPLTEFPHKISSRLSLPSTSAAATGKPAKRRSPRKNNANCAVAKKKRSEESSRVAEAIKAVEDDITSVMMASLEKDDEDENEEGENEAPKEPSAFEELKEAEAEKEEEDKKEEEKENVSEAEEEEEERPASPEKKRNAFTVMRERNAEKNKSSKPVVAPKKGKKNAGRGGERKKKEKQALIYDVVEGKKKQLKSKKAAEEENPFDEAVDSQNLSRRSSITYSRKLNASTAMSPPAVVSQKDKKTLKAKQKKASKSTLPKNGGNVEETETAPETESPTKQKPGKKKNKVFDNWASNQTVHFSEVEDYDLSFA